MRAVDTVRGVSRIGDWLYGPRVIRISEIDAGGLSSTWHFGSAVIGVDDLTDILDELRRVGLEPTVRSQSGADIDYLTASDHELGKVFVEGPAVPNGAGPIWLTLGADNQAAAVFNRCPSGTDDRIVEIISKRGRRRLGYVRGLQLLHVPAYLAVAALWVWLAIESWPSVPIILFGAVGSIALGHWLRQVITGWGANHPPLGSVTLDATTRLAQRQKRWSDRRDMKVAAVTAVVTITATAAVTWLLARR